MSALDDTLDAFQSTFEFARNLLASSQTFRERILRIESDGDESTTIHQEAAAREFIYREYRIEESNESEEGETAPNDAPAIEPRPCGVIIKGDDQRGRSGVGEWNGTGRLGVVVEAEVPAEYRVDYANDSPETQKTKHNRRKQWAEWACQLIREEIQENAGKNDGAGNAYLNAMNISVMEGPGDSEDQETDRYVGWVYEVEWR